LNGALRVDGVGWGKAGVRDWGTGGELDSKGLRESG